MINRNAKIFVISSLAWILLLTLTMGSVGSAYAQGRIKKYEAYIEKYAPEAIRQMKRHGIPASITMAQALLESGAGTSRLARQGNNHFGIKCHNDWQGATISAHDDERNECFRKYRSVWESYEDHSLFLKKRRYERLFQLSQTDYQQWAHGLQACGYATNKRYGNLLIGIIKTYSLHRLDKSKKPEWSTHNEGRIEYVKRNYEAYYCYGLLYVVAKQGDTFKSIAHSLDVSAYKLARFNEIPADVKLQEGDVVYMERKNRRAKHPYTWHIVNEGESMHSIAQRYGIQLKALLRLNHLENGFVPRVGDELRLR